MNYIGRIWYISHSKWGLSRLQKKTLKESFFNGVTGALAHDPCIEVVNGEDVNFMGSDKSCRSENKPNLKVTFTYE